MVSIKIYTSVSTSYKKIKTSYTYQKNYHWSGVHQNLYTFIESHLKIQNYTFTFTNQSTKLHVVNPYKCVGPALCGCFQTSCPVPTRIKNPFYALRLVGNISYNLYRYTCCETPIKSNFLKKGKIAISVKSKFL